MRIALLTRNLDDNPTNGFERYAHNLRDGLVAKGADVLLINQDPPVNVRPSGSLISPPFYDILLPILRLLTGKANADIYHALTDSQAVLFPFLKGKKIITIHHVDLTPPGSPSEALFRRFYELGTDLAVKYADHFICISNQTKKELMEHYDVAEDKISVVPHAISPKFRPMKKPGLTIGYLGALKKRKNVEMAIRAYALMQERHPLPQCKFNICGEGPDEARLKAVVQELGLGEQVVFKGQVPEERILETYNSFTVFAFPSLQEGFGFPILEAQACGVPVLVLKGSMVPEEVTRRTIECTDESEMAEMMYRLLSDEGYRETVVKDGLDYAATFSVDSLATRTFKIYQTVYGK